MKMKSKNQSSGRNRGISQSYDSKLKTSLALSFEFCICVFRFSFFVFCFLISLSHAEISSEQLDPTNFLVPSLAKLSQDVTTLNVTVETSRDSNAPNAIAETSQDVNTPDVPMQVTVLPSARQEQSQTGDIAPVKFAAQVIYHPEQKKPLTLSHVLSNVEGEIEGQESLLTEWQGLPALPQSLPRAYRGDDSKKRSQLPHAGSTISENPNSRVQNQLWQARITIPRGEKDEASKNKLQRIIEQVRAVEFEPQDQTSEPVIVAELAPTIEPPVPTIEPDETLSDIEAPEESNAKQIESKLTYEPVADQTLQMLGNLSQHPDQLSNPFELAEVLFLSGHLKEASVFYREALKRRSPDEAGSAQNRAWTLFQIGNCLRDDNLPMAMRMYKQLITEYPESPWTDLAKTRHELIDWYQKDKPRKLISENQS